MTESQRPAPPRAPDPGCEWAPAEEDGRWGVAPAGKKCRWRSTEQRAHGAPAVISVLRGLRSPRPWYYCGLHSYGRWVEGGRVMTWRQRPIGETPARGGRR